MKLGSHVGNSGKEMFLGSVKEALSYNANCFMIYTGAPQNTRRKDVKDMCIEEAHALMKKHNLPLDNVVVHAPYIMNLANPDSEKRLFAINFLTSEVIRTSALGVTQIVLHPGAALKQDRTVAISHIANGLNQVIKNTKDLDVKIALETMAGKGTEIGKTFEELKQIIDLVEHDERISICVDTCHIHDSGYDIVNDYEGVLKEFDSIIGLDRIGVFHINDSKNVLGAAKDRHENIGHGYIGFETLSKIIHDKRFLHLPKMLETPYVTEYEGAKDKIYPPYKYEIAAFKAKKENKELLFDIRAQK